MNEAIAKNTADINDAMFHRSRTNAEIINEVIALTLSAGRLLNVLKNRYPDKRSNLEEAKHMTDDIVGNMVGHKKDIAEGKE